MWNHALNPQGQARVVNRLLQRRVNHYTDHATQVANEEGDLMEQALLLPDTGVAAADAAADASALCAPLETEGVVFVRGCRPVERQRRHAPLGRIQTRAHAPMRQTQVRGLLDRAESEYLRK